MTLIADELNRNRAVARRFGARATTYDCHADLQRRIADNLAAQLPRLEAPSVLEIGCGTGFLTRRLTETYPNGRFLISDLAAEMLAECQARIGQHGNRRFAVLDGEAPDTQECFDLIAASMTFQWFSDPLMGIERLRGLLRPGGELWFATLGAENFPEWRTALAEEGLPDGTVAMPILPGIVHETREAIRYASARDFLAAMRSIGATRPRAGYRPMPPGSMRRALRRLENDHGANVTWHIVFGRIAAQSPAR